jgi:hypothetical protein
MLIGIYPHLRYSGGLAGGGDAGRSTMWISSIQDQKTIIPSEDVYPNGYGYQTLIASLADFTGMELAVLQTLFGTLLITWTILMAWLFYSEVTQSKAAASLAILILFTQPELLFVLLRGTHEKFTRGLMFVCLYLIVRSVLSQKRPRLFISFVVAFYLTGYALLTFNNLLAISFIAALALSLALNTLVARTNANDMENSFTRRRLVYATVVLLVLAFIFTFYAYPPARKGLEILQYGGDRLAVLFLDIEQASAKPYETITTAWVNKPVYFLVSIANWLLLISSFVLWTVMTLKWLLRRSWPSDQRLLLLWSLYGAFGFLGALSIVIDVSGALRAQNLQYRSFPSFVMIAAPLVSLWLVHTPSFTIGIRRLPKQVLIATIALLIIIAITKATNEPLLSNTWAFYTADEEAAAKWTLAVNSDKPLWLSFDERLRSSIMTCCAAQVEANGLDAFAPQLATRDFLISDVTRAQALRSGLNLPIEGDSLLFYDNGSSKVFHLRPTTPFQR